MHDDESGTECLVIFINFLVLKKVTVVVFVSIVFGCLLALLIHELQKI